MWCPLLKVTQLATGNAGHVTSFAFSQRFLFHFSLCIPFLSISNPSLSPSMGREAMPSTSRHGTVNLSSSCFVLVPFSPFLVLDTIRLVSPSMHHHEPPRLLAFGRMIPLAILRLAAIAHVPI